MTLRTAIFSTLLFLFALLLAIIFLIPLNLVVEQTRDYIPEGVQIQPSGGTVFFGSVLVSSSAFNQPLPINWRPCFIDLLHPLGFCLLLRFNEVDLRLALQPWSLGNTINLYSISFDTKISNLAELHSSLAVLSVVQGAVTAYITELSLTNKRVLYMEGQIQLTDVVALGLEVGTINTLITSELTGDNGAHTISMSMDGGTIDKIKLQGIGTVNPSGRLIINLLLQSNDSATQQQLGVIAKQKSATEFELDYAFQLF